MKAWKKTVSTVFLGATNAPAKVGRLHKCGPPAEGERRAHPAAAFIKGLRAQAGKPLKRFLDPRAACTQLKLGVNEKDTAIVNATGSIFVLRRIVAGHLPKILALCKLSRRFRWQSVPQRRQHQATQSQGNSQPNEDRRPNVVPFAEDRFNPAGQQHAQHLTH